MNSKETPETDKLITDWMQGITRDLPDFVGVARKLERERNEARKEAARWRDAWESNYKMSMIISTKLPWEDVK